jgi:hypothetical protein
MPFEQAPQGGGTQTPNIPKMEAAAPPPLAARPAVVGSQTTAQEARQAAKELKQELQDATKEFRQAQGGGGNTPVIAVPPRGFQVNDRDVPPRALEMSYGFMTTFAICVIGFPLARAIARRIDGRSRAPNIPAADLTPHLRQLQDSVDSMAIEIERISEGQRFTSKLLAERVGAPKIEGKSVS